MFVKVVYQSGYSSVYECQCVHILNLSETEIAFEMEGSKMYPRLDVNKRDGTEVYLMNDDGRTIDTYRWPAKEREIVDGNP